MEYLGHALSSEGVQPVDRLTQCRHRGEALCSSARYYRKFIEATWVNRSAIDDTTYLGCWTEAQEFAFERIKFLLTTKPLLKYPDFGREFRLVTDASTVGLGACLTQDFGHGWQPIAFASKVYSHAESNYSITEPECLAVAWAVKQFRPYLYGRAFEIITDHAALRWLMTRPNLAGRLQRWSLTLQEYDFVINYRPGATNVVADALSRAPAALKTNTTEAGHDKYGLLNAYGGCVRIGRSGNEWRAGTDDNRGGRYRTTAD
ncbi:Retrotransposable element [Phytophthora megakarya]|uniref:Retrotransposable element n=1 Tax=Phytophthora megakarya TaxID=4795 RepID=A0A225VM36_9STRA|nr:Retrotransposable element [Phytophthora megakarya]